MSSPSIAIIGAGPAGLTLALLLNRRSLQPTIFEYRSKTTEAEFSEPCGVLDLHDESGQAALKEGGLYDEFLQLTGECSEAQRVCDIDGNVLYADEGELSDRPEVSRHALTKLLLEHVPPQTIQWEHKLISATSVANRTTLDFGNKGKQTFDFVIGADGAWSKIRNLVTNVKPKYAGVHNITMTIRGVTQRFPEIANFVGPGSFSALALHHGVMSQRGPQDSARIYCFLSTAEDFASAAGLADMSPSQAATALLHDDSLLGKWGDKVKNLVTVACEDEETAHTDGKVDIKAMYSLPIGHSWTHKPGVTLIGDAAHLMPPWAGEGVNLAMWDALDLSRALAEAVQAWKGDGNFGDVAGPSVRQYEEKMFPRVQEKAEETKSNGEMLFGDDAARKFVDFFEQAYGPRPVDVETS
jgi:2-polyprenyl-6-methoxyphenol hydroxylase-like FAD-dependent oxidoreductase